MQFNSILCNCISQVDEEIDNTFVTLDVSLITYRERI